MTKPTSAPQLIKACLENPALAERYFEQVYLMGQLVYKRGFNFFSVGGMPADYHAFAANGNRFMDGIEGVLVSDGLGNKSPVSYEQTALESGLVEELSEHIIVYSKNAARAFKGVHDSFTLVSDTLVIVDREAQEPAVLLAVRDANAPTPNRECLPGGWVGPADWGRTADVKLKNEVRFRIPGNDEPTDFASWEAVQAVQPVEIEGLTRPFVLSCEGMRDQVVKCIPFFHLAAKSDFEPDANMLNMLSVTRVRIPFAGTVIEDATGFGRQMVEVPISQFGKERGRPTLPSVDFVRDTVLPKFKP